MNDHSEACQKTRVKARVSWGWVSCCLQLATMTLTHHRFQDRHSDLNSNTPHHTSHSSSKEDGNPHQDQLAISLRHDCRAFQQRELCRMQTRIARTSCTPPPPTLLQNQMSDHFGSVRGRLAHVQGRTLRKSKVYDTC